VSRFQQLLVGNKKGLQVLYSQPFNSARRIVLYVPRFPGAASVYRSQLGLLLLCWWYIAVVAIAGNLPGTTGLSFADGQVFTLKKHWLAPCLGSHCVCASTARKCPAASYLNFLVIYGHIEYEVIEEGLRTCP